MSEKTKGELLKEQLLLDPKHGAEVFSQEKLEKAFAFSEDYKKFLDRSKTEREAVSSAVAMAEEKGYRPFDPKTHYQAGDKVYWNNRGKSLILAVIGSRPLEEGVRIAASHIDSPRLDLKPTPLYEDSQIALLKTHYYGGVRKYQWTALPLALHGVVVKANGEKVTVTIGEDPGDPILYISDLLPHLAKDQAKRTLEDGIRGEEMNLIIGSLPIDDEKVSDKVKLNIMRLLNEKYGIVEQDFWSAELETVPAMKANDVGLDRSMIASYGHDDRVCAYTSLMAELECGTPEVTHVTILADKEEIGSVGNTGLNSSYFNYFILNLAEAMGANGRIVLSNSTCLSADVNAAFDHTFPDVMERRNCTYLNQGVGIMKYTGSRGKGGTSDASAEFMGQVRSMLNNAGVLWQVGELGKVDQGGGGTVAMYIASLNVDVVDIGVPVISMHSPYEVVSKIDVYSAYEAFKAFFEEK